MSEANCGISVHLFNPRSHERSDCLKWSAVDFQHTFQSTLPREERRMRETDALRHRAFSIHAPTRGATASVFRPGLPASFQSTLPREERPAQVSEMSQKYFSIHAPTRGATRRNKRSHSLKFFNPRSHERSDIRRGFICFDICFSIHAPTRGATAILHKKFVYFYTIPTINI